MKDDYRWYNSALFDQREEFLKRFPELSAQVYNNKSLKPFLNKPDHVLQQENFRDNRLKEGGVSPASPAGEAAPKSPGSQPATLFVCCPQEENMQRHGMLPSQQSQVPPPGMTNEQAINTLNAPRNGKQVMTIRQEQLFSIRRMGRSWLQGTKHDVH